MSAIVARDRERMAAEHPEVLAGDFLERDPNASRSGIPLDEFVDRLHGDVGESPPEEMRGRARQGGSVAPFFAPFHRGGARPDGSRFEGRAGPQRT